MVNKTTVSLFTFLLFAASAWSQSIPQGNYRFIRAVCSNGKVLNLGGKFININITLNITDVDMIQHISDDTIQGQAPFKLNCNVINRGTFSYLNGRTIQGYLAKDSCSCRQGAWTIPICAKGIGTQKDGPSTFSYANGILSLKSANADEHTRACPDRMPPTYYYQKI
ncbi:MAG: hypothetical protein ACOCUH_02905 [Bacteriovoracia bacterium]